MIATTVGDHLRRVNVDQATEESLEWKVLRFLLPEALDPVTRDQLTYFDALPKWASTETDSER